MKKINWMAFPVILLLTFATTAAAQDFPTGDLGDLSLSAQEGSAQVPVPGVDSPPNAFGGEWQWTVLHSSRFLPWDNSANPGYLGSGYITPGSAGNIYWAQIDLPVGAEIISVMWQVYDGTATGNFSSLTVTRYQAARAGTVPDLEILQTLSTGEADAPGYVLLQNPADFPVMVRAYEDIDGSGGADFVAYALNAYTSGTPTSQLGLFGATIVWTRVISPAPAVATFPDVGTGFWAFQYIEALVASGIIDGFPDGTFKPADPITRAQVAKMFAVALGSHWPY